MKKTVLVPIADGTEEIEAVCMIDTLRRAEADVTVASVKADTVIKASRGVKILADALLTDLTDRTYNLIALPGGMPGASHLAQSNALIRMLKDQKEAGRLYAAICAAPAVVFDPNGLIPGLNVTCFPAMQDQIKSAHYIDEGVVIDRICITGQGPGFALPFALVLVEQLFGRPKRDQIAHDMLLS